MARPYNQMIGWEYTVADNGQSYTIYCSYLCPYCDSNSYSSFILDKSNAAGVEILEQGEFFENLTCSCCGKRSDVRFHYDMKR